MTSRSGDLAARVFLKHKSKMAAETVVVLPNAFAFSDDGYCSGVVFLKYALILVLAGFPVDIFKRL